VEGQRRIKKNLKIAGIWTAIRREGLLESRKVTSTSTWSVFFCFVFLLLTYTNLILSDSFF
jgi:hypothetical protein